MGFAPRPGPGGQERGRPLARVHQPERLHGRRLLLFRSRGWVFTRRAFPGAIFLAAALGYTIWSEWFHTRVALSWSYSGRMPTLFGIGVAPMLQWIVVPSLVLFGLRRLRQGVRSRIKLEQRSNREERSLP